MLFLEMVHWKLICSYFSCLVETLARCREFVTPENDGEIDTTIS